MIPVNKKFSHLGFTIVFYLLISNLMAVACVFFAMFFYALFHGIFLFSSNYHEIVIHTNELLKDEFFVTIVSLIPTCFICVPVTITVLNNGLFRDVPLTRFSFTTPYEKSQTRKLSFGEFMVFFLVTFPAGIIGSSIGQGLAGGISYLTGLNISDFTVNSIASMKPWQVILTAVIMSPIFEELLFRYAVIGYCRRYGEWNAILVSSLIFAMIHTNIFQFFYAFFVGLVFGYVFIYTGKIRYTIIMHILFNFCGGFIPTLILDYTSGDTPIYIFSFVRYIIAIIGLILFIIYSTRHKLLRTNENAPIQNCFCKEALINPGMICFYLVSIALTIYAAIGSIMGTSM